ncbi:MAG: hypothetical protein ACOH5I_04175 [Oligoflexus sp.]
MATDMEKNEAHLAKLRSMSQAKSFLGREFLTWLWYLSETTQEPLSVTGPTSNQDYMVDIWVDDRVTLEAPTGKSHYHTIKGGDPSQSAEAATALMTGKTPKDLKLGMNIHELGEFIFTLSGDNITPKSIHLPEAGESLQESEHYSPIGFRLTALEALCEVIDGLFSLFMDERIDQNRYQEFRQQIKEWIKARPSGSESLLH